MARDVEMKAFLHYMVRCPGCGCVLMAKDKGIIECIYERCSLFGKRFHAPSVELVPVEQEHEVEQFQSGFDFRGAITDAINAIVPYMIKSGGCGSCLKLRISSRTLDISIGHTIDRTIQATVYDGQMKLDDKLSDVARAAVHKIVENTQNQTGEPMP